MISGTPKYIVADRFFVDPTFYSRQFHGSSNAPINFGPLVWAFAQFQTLATLAPTDNLHFLSFNGYILPLNCIKTRLEKLAIACHERVKFPQNRGGLYPTICETRTLKRLPFTGIVFTTWKSRKLNIWYMDKEKFYKTVYKLVEDYFNSFAKKPNYLAVNSSFDLSKCIDQEDLKRYGNDSFKGMLIVRTPDISTDKVMVY